MTFLEENWKDIPGYEGLYQVSDLGNVKSLSYRKSKKPKLLKIYTDGNGYRWVKLKGKKKKISILMAISFLPNPVNLPQVDHRDRVRSNDILENLRWSTVSDNMKNRDTTNFKRGNENNKTVLTEEVVIKIKALRKQGLGKRKIAKILGITPNQAQSGFTNWKHLD